jgi:hypothetical protein
MPIIVCDYFFNMSVSPYFNLRLNDEIKLGVRECTMQSAWRDHINISRRKQIKIRFTFLTKRRRATQSPLWRPPAMPMEGQP